MLHVYDQVTSNKSLLSIMWVGILHSVEAQERKPEVSLRDKEIWQGYPRGYPTIMPVDYKTAYLSPPGQASLIEGPLPQGVQPAFRSQALPPPSSREQRVVPSGPPGLGQDSAGSQGWLGRKDAQRPERTCGLIVGRLQRRQHFYQVGVKMKQDPDMVLYTDNYSKFQNPSSSLNVVS